MCRRIQWCRSKKCCRSKKTQVCFKKNGSFLKIHSSPQVCFNYITTNSSRFKNHIVVIKVCFKEEAVLLLWLFREANNTYEQQNRWAVASFAEEQLLLFFFAKRAAAQKHSLLSKKNKKHHENSASFLLFLEQHLFGSAYQKNHI